MGMNGVGSASPYQASGMVGVGLRTLNMAHQAQTDMAEKLLPIRVAQNGARAASEARGMMVDTYA
jgi:hypothetical protein